MDHNKRARVGEQDHYVPLRTLSDDQLARIRLNHEKALAKLVANHYMLLTPLPNEIWHYILSLLPVSDFRQCRSTCKQFKVVIDSDQFCFWKRQRHTNAKMPMSFVPKTDDGNNLSDYDICECFAAHHNLNSIVDIITLFTSHLYSSFRVSQPNQKYMQYGHEALSIFGHIRGIHRILETTAVIINSKHLQALRPKIGVWAVSCIVIMLSVGWKQIVDIAEALILRSSAGRPDVTEFLHLLWCIFAGTRVWTKHKYGTASLTFDIACGLRFLEGSVFAGKTWAERSLQGKPIYELTQEQRAVVECDVEKGQVLMVTAFAGAGKTSSLIEYARRRPGKRFLYLAYSKALEQEAPHKFRQAGCRNVTARTIHSIAFSHYKTLFGHKIRDEKSLELAIAVTEALSIQLTTAKYVLKTLKSFHISRSSTVLRDHVPFGARLHHELLRKTGEEKENYTNVDEFYIGLAERVWTQMKDPANMKIHLTHDGYLKLYHLEIHTIPRFGYDVIMLDEAQDINPVISEILTVELTTQGLIMVGDPHQQIYAFRGAVDAMRRFRSGAIRRLTLSQSFRFGPEIAMLANVVLNSLKMERKSIFGMGRPGQVVNEVGEIIAPQKTIICRSNSGVFTAACGLEGKKIFLWGKTKLDTPLYQDLIYMATGRINKVKNLNIKKHGTLSALLSHADRVKDFRLADQIGVVMTYQGNENLLEECIYRVTHSIVSTAEEADVILTNVHQAKGMEWDCVELYNDFSTVFEASFKGCTLAIHTQGLREGKRKKMNEEYNILYVAMTRAKQTLKLNSSLKSLLNYCSGGEIILRKSTLLTCPQHQIQYPLFPPPPQEKNDDDLVDATERQCNSCFADITPIADYPIKAYFINYELGKYFTQQNLHPLDIPVCPECPEPEEYLGGLTQVCHKCLLSHCPEWCIFLEQ